MMMIVADIDEETKKLEKRYKPPAEKVCRLEGLVEEPASGKQNPRMVEKISRNLKIVERKKSSITRRRSLRGKKD